MNGARNVKLGEVCRVEKGGIGISKAIAGDYPLVTTGTNRASHNEYQFDAEAICIPLISSAGHGKASLNYVHYQEGKFALGNILCACIPKDKNLVSAKYLQLFFQAFKDALIVPLMSGTANVSLSVDKIKTIEFQLPPIEIQKSIVARLQSFSALHRQALDALARLQTDVQRLRQSILQQAIQGKLTPATPPLSGGGREGATGAELLADIQAEKRRLAIEQGKKPPAALPPVTDEERAFEVPEGWVWTRLGEVVEKMEYGTSEKSATELKNGVPVLGMNHIQNGEIRLSNLKFVSPEIDDLPKLYLEKDDILFNRTNSFELVGKAGVFKGSDEKMTFASYLIRVSLLKKFALPAYINSYINSNWCRKNQIEPKTIQQNGQANFNGSKLQNILVPLPPLSQQERIVETLETRFAQLTHLETHLATLAAQAARLWKSELQQTFKFDTPRPGGTQHR